MAQLVLEGEVVIAGNEKGVALVSDEPLSFWGGYDWQTGEIIDQRHALAGEIAKDRILAIPFTRGSSTTTAVLLEAIRAGTAPAAIITTETDFFFALASVVADEMTGVGLTLLTLSKADFGKLSTGDLVEVTSDGRVVIFS